LLTSYGRQRWQRNGVERRLTAILAADVVGYSRLMGADEEGTLAALKMLRREVADLMATGAVCLVRFYA
jgi:class 3 adenylate cyclase